ncbi:MAG TPA: acylphosphatase [Candidatus Bathyarchaeia archaeon]|nr:acylphosphatase [Candidatus Bathyarchaeia archaeon]
MDDEEIMVRVRAQVLVGGRVQGVFFRLETQDEARRNNVTGWVQNLPDGRVEASFEGEKANVDKLIEFCRRGPPGARVTNIEVSWEKPTAEFNNFVIRY